MDVIDVLTANVTNVQSSDRLREASLDALGYTCQDLPPDVLESMATQIFTALAHGMSTDQMSVHVRQAATKAMLNSLESAEDNFSNEVPFSTN